MRNLSSSRGRRSWGTSRAEAPSRVRVIRFFDQVVSPCASRSARSWMAWYYVGDAAVPGPLDASANPRP